MQYDFSPFFPSPMVDHGYDVADYCDVDPLFGNLDVFDGLVGRAHSLGIRIMIDWVRAWIWDNTTEAWCLHLVRNGPWRRPAIRQSSPRRAFSAPTRRWFCDA